MTRICLSLAMAGVLLGVRPAEAAPQNGPDPREVAEHIDKSIAARWAEAGVQPAAKASDAEFLRRVYLDILGRIPRVAEVRAFLADTSADKRAKLIEHLLKEPGHVKNLSNVWKSMLLPEDNAANFQLRLFVPSLEAWLNQQFADNVPYDVMVRELITLPMNEQTDPRRIYQPGSTADPSPLAFYLAKEMKPEDLAAASSRLFLGVKLECAQCHDHPFAHWTREQFWEFAAFYASISREGGNIFGPVAERPDRREIAIPNTSQVVQASFLDGREPRWKYKVSPRVTLAEWLTSPENPYFARAAVNRTWAHFFGMGIIDPVDNMSGEDSKASHPALLDDLARAFVASGFDQKFLIRAITLSKTYQLSSTQTHPTQDEPQMFARMAVKGLSPEQLFDSLAAATGFREPPSPQQPFVINDNSTRGEFLTKFASQDKRTEVQTSILQALALMNGRFTATVTDLQRSEALTAIADAPFLTTEERIETLYLATLSRKPRPAEMQRLVTYVESGGPKKDPKVALGDVLWALINTSEFILNH